jgi:hypothetical protein
VAFSNIKPGLGRNIILTGHVNGEIKLWCADTLKCLRFIPNPGNLAITALSVKPGENDIIVSADTGGNCFIHNIKKHLVK